MAAELKEKIQSLEKELENANDLLSDAKHRGDAFYLFTFIHLADAFIQSDFRERALQKRIGQ